MNTEKLKELLVKIIECNRSKCIDASFRYSKQFGNESLAIDFIYNGENIFHYLIESNDSLNKAFIEVDNVLSSNSIYILYYLDEFIKIDKKFFTRELVEKEHCDILKKYGIDCEIKTNKRINNN